MRRIESIIALRSEPIKNIFPLLPSIICPDARSLILSAKTGVTHLVIVIIYLYSMYFFLKHVAFLTASVLDLTMIVWINAICK